MLLSPNAFFPTMPRNLGRPLGGDSCANMELMFDLLLFDILSRIPASGVCVNCQNSVGCYGVEKFLSAWVGLATLGGVRNVLDLGLLVYFCPLACETLEGGKFHPDVS